MFCINCGAKISDGAKFCAHCGAKQGSPDEQTSFNNTIADKVNINTKLVPAKCTNCGGQLTVNPDQQAAVCPFCNSAFIVEQAINNYNVKMNGNLNVGSATINVQGLNTNNLVARAKSFEAQKKYEMALDYFDRVLDIDVHNTEAIDGTYRVKEKIRNYVYLSGITSTFFGTKQKFEITREKIIIKDKADKVLEEYAIKLIEDEELTNFSTYVCFKYPGKQMGVILRVGRDMAKKVFKFIQDAKIGILPDYR